MRQLKIQKSITNRSSEALDKYLVEIGREPLVSIEEEIEQTVDAEALSGFFKKRDYWEKFSLSV